MPEPEAAAHLLLRHPAAASAGPSPRPHRMAAADGGAGARQRLEMAVQKLVQRVGASDADQPITFQGGCSMAVREVRTRTRVCVCVFMSSTHRSIDLIRSYHHTVQPTALLRTFTQLITALEALLGLGLGSDASAAKVEAGSAAGAPAEPLWAVLKQVRPQKSSGQEGQVEAALAEAASAALPAFAIEYGWGRARLLLIECLKRGCLAALVDSLVLDVGLRERIYPSAQAPMRHVRGSQVHDWHGLRLDIHIHTFIHPYAYVCARTHQAETCAWLQAQAGALQGVAFAFRHWRSILFTAAAGTSEPYSSPDRRPSSLSFPFSVFSPSPDRRSGVRRRQSGSFGLGGGEQEEEGEEEQQRIKEEAGRRLHEALRLRYGVESAIGFLLQSCPWERVTVPAREQHRRAVVAKARPGSRSPSPTPAATTLGGREEEKGEASTKGGGSAGAASGRRHVAVWQWEVAYHDIGFHAALRPHEQQRGTSRSSCEDAMAMDVQPWARHPASAGMVEGSAVLPPSLSLVLRWDNRCVDEN